MKTKIKDGLVAYLGPKYSHSHLATKTYYGGVEDIVFTEMPTINKLFSMMTTIENIDTGIVPFENLLGSGVNETMDSFREFDSIRIVDEFIVPIHHCLIAPKKDMLSVATVLSHPQVHAQTKDYFANKAEKEGIRLVPVNYASSSEAVEELAEKVMIDALAIGTKEAAQAYGLTIVEENIEDNPNNETLFLEIRRENDNLPHCPRSYFLFEPSDNPHQLGQIGTVFGVNGVNLSFIQSRPTKRILSESVLFLRADISKKDSHFRQLEEDLRKINIPFRILSS